MKILITSDFHGSTEASELAGLKARSIRADVVVVCGDVTHFGSVQDAEKVLAPLIALKIPVLYVPGNCDPPELAEAEINGATCIHGKCVIQNGVSFLGLGGAPASPFRTLFELTESEISNILSEGFQVCPRSNRFVVVSHFTPSDTRVDLAFSGLHVGSVNLRRFIEDKKPDAVFCGHIHEAKAVDNIGETVLVNPGPARHGNCAIADLNKKIEVTLDSLQTKEAI